MSDTHGLILSKLERYSPDIQALAIRALELSKMAPELSVSEQLKGVVRQIIKEKEACDDSTQG